MIDAIMIGRAITAVRILVFIHSIRKSTGMKEMKGIFTNDLLIPFTTFIPVNSLLHSPEPPIALLIIQYRLKYLRSAEIWKQCRRDIDLAVSELPEQEI